MTRRAWTYRKRDIDDAENLLYRAIIIAEERRKWAAMRKRAITVLIIAIALITITLIGCDSGGNGDVGRSTPNVGIRPITSTPRVGHMNKPSLDDDFILTVTRVQTNVRTIGNIRPRGQFIIVSVIVENTDDEYEKFIIDIQRLYVKNDATAYRGNTRVSRSLRGVRMFGDAIRPGTTVSGALVFDVPRHAIPSHVVLHDSSRSRGVLVRI